MDKPRRLFDTSDPDNQLGPIVVALIIAVLVFTAALGSHLFHHS